MVSNFKKICQLKNVFGRHCSVRSDRAPRGSLGGRKRGNPLRHRSFGRFKTNFAKPQQFLPW